MIAVVTISPILKIAMRSVSLAVGLLALYVAAFLYEDEEGRLQNRLQDKLEKLWITIDDLTGTALARHTVFMRSVAVLITYAFDRLFGRRLLSMRAVGTSVCLTFASICLGIPGFLLID